MLYHHTHQTPHFEGKILQLNDFTPNQIHTVQKNIIILSYPKDKNKQWNLDITKVQ
jgi:hypothetical protein